MAKELRTEIWIQASPEKVWRVLTTFEDYPSWNPFIKSIEGEVKIGNRIAARIAPPDAQGMTFTPKVIAFEPNKAFIWLGHLWIPGLFDGRHAFELTDNLDGTTTLHHSEKFGGILVPLFQKMIDHNTKQGFIAMNEKLKERAEAL